MTPSLPLTYPLTYPEAVAYFGRLREFAPRDGRERFRALLSLLGNPHERLRTLHVAGTNGKGSTVTFLASALCAAGYKTGAYLSPFVWDVRERWQIGGALIPPDELARQVAAIRPAVDALADTEHGQITEFEMKTAVAFRYFAEQQVDFAVIEVGIGGRLDSTNVIPAPLVSVITSIGYDHQHLLGDTLALIAAEKSGIIKRGSLACVTAVTDAEPLAVIAAKAATESVPLITISGAEADEMRSFDLSLHGDFQLRNAACAAAALRVLRAAGVAQIGEPVLRQGLKQATLPGRFDVQRGGAAGDPVIVLDVAHNADAAQVLASALRQTFGAGRSAILVAGMSKGHEPRPFLAELAPLVKSVIATAPKFRARPAREVAEAAASLDLPVRIIEPVAAAVEAARQEAAANEGYVVVTGSFYVVGESG